MTDDTINTEIDTTPILNITTTKNNTVFTFTDYLGQVIISQSSGSLGFSGTRKKSKVACIETCTFICENIYKKYITKINIVFKGNTKKWRRSLLETVLINLNIKFIYDETPISHNGCKKKKKKIK